MTTHSPFLRGSPGVRLHRWPDGGLCVHRSPADDRERMTEVNESAMAVLDYWIPVHVMFELTRDCNLRCGHCYNASGLVKHPRVDTGTLLELVRRFAAEGTTLMELTGGEPMVHPDFFEVFETACAEYQRVALLSNGWFIGPAEAKRMARWAGTLLVQVDLDGAVPATHDRLRGMRGAARRAARAVRALADEGLDVRVAMTVTSFNLHEMAATIELAGGWAPAPWCAAPSSPWAGAGRWPASWGPPRPRSSGGPSRSSRRAIRGSSPG